MTSADLEALGSPLASRSRSRRMLYFADALVTVLALFSSSGSLEVLTAIGVCNGFFLLGQWTSVAVHSPHGFLRLPL
jgi:hypothetical protein